MCFTLVRVHLWLIFVTGIFGNFCTVQGGGFLSFRTKIPDGPEGSVIFVITGVTLIV